MNLFLGVPEDITFNILLRLSSKDLGRAACVWKAWRHFAQLVDKQPRWENLISLTPPPKTIADVDTLVAEWISQLNVQARPDLCLVFVSAGWHSARSRSNLLKALRKTLPTCCCIMGASGIDVIGTNQATGRSEESVRGPGVSLTLIHLPPGVAMAEWVFNPQGYRLFDSDDDEGGLDITDSIGSLESLDLGADDAGPPHFIILGDHEHRSIEDVLSHLLSVYPGCTISGGCVYVEGGRSRERPLLSALRGFASEQPGYCQASRGCLVVGFRGAGLQCRQVSVQGLKRVSGYFRVTQTQSIYIGDRQETATWLKHVEPVVRATSVASGASSSEAWVRSAEPVRSFSAVVDEALQATQDVVQIAFVSLGEGADGEVYEVVDESNSFGHGRVAVLSAAAVPVDSVVTLTQRDAAVSRSDLRLALSGCAQQCQGGQGSWDAFLACSSEVNFHIPKPVIGAFGFLCFCRGRSFYGKERNVEGVLFQEHFPGASFSGIYVAGEVGPTPFGQKGHTGSRSCFLGYTSIFDVLVLQPGM